MDITGKILQLMPAQEGQGKNGTWRRQEFIIETGDNYPKKVCISVWGDKINLGSFKAGDMVDISFDVESREYNGRWYTDVKAWKVVTSKGGSPAAGSGPSGVSRTAAPAAGGSPSFDSNVDDDLPF